MKRITNKYIYLTISACLCTLLLAGCGVYSLKSGSIPTEVKTISIDNVFNEVGGGPANISQLFTEKIKSYYQQNSRLEIVKNNGDWQLEPKIVGYSISPVAPIGGSANLSSAYNRLTIRMQAKFINTLDEKANFDQSFSFFYDYEKDKSLSNVEAQAIEEISEKIVFDIFTKTASNW